MSKRVNDKKYEQQGLKLKQFLVIQELKTENWEDTTVIVFVQ